MCQKILAFKSHLKEWRQISILQKWNCYSSWFKFRFLLYTLYTCYLEFDVTTEIDNYFNVDSPSLFHAEFYSRKSSFLVCKFSFLTFFVMWCNGIYYMRVIQNNLSTNCFEFKCIIIVGTFLMGKNLHGTFVTVYIAHK